jgi:hypothetical protein
MNRTSCCVTSIVVLLVTSPVVDGETYHVAQRDARAADENPGTLPRPWRTISRAAGTLRAGDTVVIHAGVYREYVRPQQSGTAQQPISYVAAEGEQVVITGADVISDWIRASDRRRNVA